MGGVSLRDLPPTAQTAWSALRDEVRAMLGDNLVAMWAHGGTTSISDPAHVGDLDTYVIVARGPNAPTAQRIEQAHEATAKEHGIEWDAWYILAEDAARTDPPSHAWREGSRDTCWAIHRAHWLAGRYANLHGAEPADVVRPPTWDELLPELDRELEHIERHVLEGDTDPYEATYAILTGCRILHAVASRNVVISKRAAGAWALEHFPARWHDALRIAIRTYDGQGTADDARLLATEMSPFVSYTREHLPPTGGRPPDSLPRWSGY